MTQTSFPKHDIRITLLENTHPAAAAVLESCGYSVEVIPRALEQTELRHVMGRSDVIGVRSRTKVREEHIALATRMLAIGCFSVGTDQVDIGAAEPVFAPPHAPAGGQQQASEEELAKQTQNPVADLISLPLQNNFNFGAGVRSNKMVYVLNVQPVIPFRLGEGWNLVTRTIMPIIHQPNLSPSFGGLAPSTTGTGLGDFNPTFFILPAEPGQLIWGAGPTFTLPTATDRDLGAGKWSMGPAGVALAMHGPWVYGALINNQWSVGGWGDRSVNSMLLQWFLNYNFPGGWYFTAAPMRLPRNVVESASA